MILSDECGHLLAARNRAVVIKRCTISEVGVGGGGYCHIWPLWVCTAVKGIVFPVNSGIGYINHRVWYRIGNHFPGYHLQLVRDLV